MASANRKYSFCLSRKYHDFLIESLCDYEEIALYIETVLEEENHEYQLLLKVLSNVIEAHQKMNNISDLVVNKYDNLSKILKQTKGEEIFTFLNLLKELGLSISVDANNNDRFIGDRS